MNFSTDLSPPKILRTKIYIDGFNLFYGCLKGTPYKWLDLDKLFRNHILPSVNSTINNQRYEFELIENGINFYTAKIIESISPIESVQAQQTYHNALEKMYARQIQIIEGYYSKTQSKAYLVTEGKRPLDSETVTIWKLEEKQTDVNLALDAFHDAISNKVDMAVIVSNDTDIESCMRKISELDNKVILGLVNPNLNIKPNKSLDQYSDWTVNGIHPSVLEQSQLPEVVMGGKRPSRKPLSWYPYPELVRQIIQLGQSVLKTEGAVWKYLNTPNPKYFDGAAPIDLLNTESGCLRVIDYMESYVKG